MNHVVIRLTVLLLASAGLFISACSPTSFGTGTTTPPAPAPTLVTITPAAQPTVAPLQSPSVEASPTVQATAAPTATVGTPPAGAACTNSAAFVGDVTIPDGTPLAPGQAFNKIWRIRNTGTCTWDSNYQLVFAAGEPMTATRAVAVPTTPPGAPADLLVAMSAPTTPGTHRGDWRVRIPNGTTMGFDLWVIVNVTSAAPAPTVASTCWVTPKIAFFTASPTTIRAGESATLSWGLVEGAEIAEIDNGIGGVATPGSTAVSPTDTTTYTLTARCGPNYINTAQVTIQVTR